MSGETHSQASLLADFKKLSKQVYVQEGDKATSPTTGLDKSSPSDPTTVILYSWGDALPKHVAKYAHGYRHLYPHARMVLVFSPILKALIQGLEARAQNMEPIIDAIYGGKDEKTTERVLVHAMSNTGGINLAATLYAYHQCTGSVFPHQLLVLDSTPGSSNFFANIGRWSRAMALGAAGWLPWPFVVTQTLAATFLAGLHFYGWVLGISSTAAYSTSVVNDTTLSDVGARRLYLYSKADDIIHWEDIEVHAAQARERGFDVEAELFEGTPHVGHMRKHAQKYWDAIARAWKDSAAATGSASEQ
ncbi:hypothetical protein B0T24DRAFT_250125 [Lasiosphaeria ovina]|uniref:Indole-diterpene biosynthesis protein PaxU n=1 Tax=Lasiosphaeria ovina TaxID=92902 RepID=A0AAE0KAK8_9PEZI|nr:hypothetical protein B0T24DRAFT_250125 [Lasiosphaeria ovina]